MSFLNLVTALQDAPDLSVTTISLTARDGRMLRTLWSKLFVGLRVVRQVLSSLPRADVVSVHANNPVMLAVLVGLCKLLRRPIVVRVFGGSLDTRYGRPVDRLLLRLVFRSDCVLLQTRYLVEFFEREFPGANLRLFPTSRPFVRDPVRTTSRGGVPHPAKRFVFIGSVKPAKGILEILDACNSLRADDDVRVDIYGPMGEGMEERLLHQSERVAYRGVVANTEVPSVLRDADVLLLPTYYSGEGYPGIIIEAFMAGLPVITTTWRSIPEIVEDGVSGILVPPRDAGALAAAMQQLIDDPARLAILREGAAKQQEYFGLQRWTDVFVDICRQLV